MMCPCEYPFAVSEGATLCYHCNNLKIWGNYAAMTPKKINQEYFTRVARMTSLGKRLEELGEDVSDRRLNIMTYEQAEVINHHNMYGEMTADEVLLPPAPERLYRCNAFVSELTSLTQSFNRYYSEVRSFQNVFGFASKPSADRCKHAMLAWAKAHPPKKV
jgi:hypothetical protein